MFLNRMQPNLVTLGQRREEGELPDMADLDSILGHTDSLIVENALNWMDEPSLMAGAWNDRLTGW